MSCQNAIGIHASTWLFIHNCKLVRLTKIARTLIIPRWRCFYWRRDAYFGRGRVAFNKDLICSNHQTSPNSNIKYHKPILRRAQRQIPSEILVKCQAYNRTQLCFKSMCLPVWLLSLLHLIAISRFCCLRHSIFSHCNLLALPLIRFQVQADIFWMKKIRQETKLMHFES